MQLGRKGGLSPPVTQYQPCEALETLKTCERGKKLRLFVFRKHESCRYVCVRCLAKKIVLLFHLLGALPTRWDSILCSLKHGEGCRGPHVSEIFPLRGHVSSSPPVIFHPSTPCNNRLLGFLPRPPPRLRQKNHDADMFPRPLGSRRGTKKSETCITRTLDRFFSKENRDSFAPVWYRRR